MTLQEIGIRFLEDLSATRWYEYLAVASGIISVWFSKKENIWVYPSGLFNTIIYVFISLKGHLPGEASVNLYYTIMSMVGWYQWHKKDSYRNFVLHISYTTKKERISQWVFFAVIYIVLYFSLLYFKTTFFEGAIPWADALAAASAFTGMWLMTKKKIESWWWWIVTNLVSIPLYFSKHYVFTSLYYIVLLILAVFGLIAWKQKYRSLSNES